MSSKRLIDRGTLIRKELWTRFSDVQAVLQTNSELAIDDNRGLIAEAHAWLDRGLVAAHEVGPFMSIESDAVTRAVRQSRSFVVGTKARVGDHFARGGVH